VARAQTCKSKQRTRAARKKRRKRPPEEKMREGPRTKKNFRGGEKVTDKRHAQKKGHAKGNLNKKKNWVTTCPQLLTNVPSHEVETKKNTGKNSFF